METNETIEKEETELESDTNPYKESAYGVYHNGCLELMALLCSSNEPQDKVRIAMNMIVNMRSDIAVKGERIDARLGINK